MQYIMTDLDIKDKKILYHLDLNSRQSFSSIGKKVGLHRNHVLRRVNKLIEQGVIWRFTTYIDPTKLGFLMYRFYFVFQYATPSIRKKMVEELVNNKYSMFVNSCEGQIDLSVYFCIHHQNVYHFQRIWEGFYSKYRNYFSKAYFSIWCYLYTYPYTFLVQNNHEKRSDAQNIMIIGGGQNVVIDELDVQMLKRIFGDARLPTVELAQNLKVTSATITARLKKLERFGIIKGYSIYLDFNKLDYNLYKLDIYLQDYKLRNKINNYIITNPAVRNRYISLGDSADLEYELNLKNVSFLHEFMEDVMMQFPDSIKNYTYFNSLKRHKFKIETLM